MSSALRPALLASLIVLVAGPGPALASSIAVIENNNVWLVSPDGSRTKQVTSDGTDSRPYRFPSQADDGTILAEIDDAFVRLRPDGSRVGPPVPGIGTDARHSGNVTVMAGPTAPKISPDGTRFAYWISARGLTECPVWDPGCSFADTDYTIVSRVDRFTEPAEFGAVDSYRDPSWIGNGRLLVFNHGNGLKEGAISTVGAGEAGLAQWFDPPADLPQVAQGELSRQGDKLVALAGSSAVGFSEEYVFLYGVSDAYPAPPQPKCYFSDAAPPSHRFMQPTWSPDGTQLALTESDGVHVFSNIPDLRAPNPNCGQITERALGFGTEPGWGPTDLPSNPPPTPPTRPGRDTPTKPMTRLKVAKRQDGRSVRLRVRISIAGSAVRVRLLAGARHRLMGTAATRAARSGTLRLKVLLNRRGRAALRHKHSLPLTVHVAITPPGGTPTTATRRVTLQRQQRTRPPRQSRARYNQGAIGPNHSPR